MTDFDKFGIYLVINCVNYRYCLFIGKSNVTGTVSQKNQTWWESGTKSPKLLTDLEDMIGNKTKRTELKRSQINSQMTPSFVVPDFKKYLGFFFFLY